MQFLIANAWAAAPAQGQGNPGGQWSFLILIAVIGVLFYFMLIRPQQKRQKQHRQMVEQLGVGDEIVTSGGMLGKVTQLGEQYIGLEISKGVEIRIQKNAIGAVLPKGTIKHG